MGEKKEEEKEEKALFLSAHTRGEDEAQQMEADVPPDKEKHLSFLSLVH